jgi:replicative DNA helicase
VNESNDVEVAILSAVMVRPGQVLDDADHLTGGMFHSPVNGAIWDTARRIWETDGGLDATLLLQACQADTTFTGAADRVLDAVTGSGIPSLAPVYARRIHDAYVRRQIDATASRMHQSVMDEDMPTDMLMENVRAWVDGCDDTITDAPLIGEDMEGWTETWMNGVRLMPLPWESLNYPLGGLAPGALTVIAGAPSNGKSIVALQIADAVAKNGLLVSYTSTEMTQRELMNRLVSSQSLVPITKIQRHEADDVEKARWRTAAGVIGALPFSVNPRSPATVRSIRSHARTLKRRGELGLIVVDYLQQIESTSHKHSEYERMNEVSAHLKRLAMEMQVPVVVVSSVNRNRRIGVSPRDTPPTLDDLRGSGTIGHDADMVLFCEIDQEDPGTALIYVAKNRNGERGLWIALRNRAYVMRFEDPRNMPGLG